MEGMRGTEDWRTGKSNKSHAKECLVFWFGYKRPIWALSPIKKQFRHVEHQGPGKTARAFIFSYLGIGIQTDTNTY
jgi:hypothetical protein